MRDFQKLKVWEKSHHLALAIYKTTASFPKEELYGLTSQIRRAASSIAANIAEGCGRTGQPELVRFCCIAMGSASELESHLLLARDLGFWEGTEHRSLSSQISEIKQMLTGFVKKLKADD